MKSLALLRIPKSYTMDRGISQSQMKDFVTCRMRWLFRINGLTSPESSLRTNFGSVFHWLLAKLYSKKLTTIDAAITEFHVLNKLPSSQEVEDDCALASAVFEVYKDIYAADLDKEYIAVEKEYVLKKGRDCRKVIVDGLYRDKTGLWLLETKTAGRIDEDGMVTQYSIDIQNLFSVTTIEEVLGQPVKGVLRNLIRKPQLRRKDSESLADFCARVSADIRTRPEFYFMRHEVVYTKKDKDRFLSTEYRGIHEDMFRVVTGVSHVYRNSSVCLMPYKCQYLNACASGDCSGLVKAVRTR